MWVCVCKHVKSLFAKRVMRQFKKIEMMMKTCCNKSYANDEKFIFALDKTRFANKLFNVYVDPYGKCLSVGQLSYPSVTCPVHLMNLAAGMPIHKFIIGHIDQMDATYI